MIYDKKLLEKLGALIETAEHIVILQAEHIDADSLGSSLGLESALGALGKKVTMYCHDEVPSYLQHMPGWDRVTQDLPAKFDLTILVDSSTKNQLERTWSKHKSALLKRPFVCIDHHASTTGQLEGDNVLLVLDDKAGASGQQVVELTRHFGWELDENAAYALSAAIKADTVNLATRSTTERTFEAMAYLMSRGADLEKLRENIEQNSSISATQLPIRVAALTRTQLFHNNQIAITYFTREEYTQMSEDQLLIERMKHELRTLKETKISVVITERKGYSNASMRANVDIARKVAEHFGGGGHDRAASCRFDDAKHEEVIEAIVPIIERFLDEAI